MVKSLCGELPDMYSKWLNRQPWYIEEQNQKVSEAAYAQFADGARSAANQGYADAEYMMGEFCMEGFGVTKSISEASLWWMKVSAQGHAGARQALERLGNGLSNLLNSL